jgi:hypothetical protein
MYLSTYLSSIYLSSIKSNIYPFFFSIFLSFSLTLYLFFFLGGIVWSYNISLQIKQKYKKKWLLVQQINNCDYFP